MKNADHNNNAGADSLCRTLANGYLDLLTRKNADAAVALLLHAVQDGLPLKELYLEVLQPAQYELGRLWQTGTITVAEEHYCTAAAQQVMSRLYPSIFSTPKNGKVLVAACGRNELHEIGLRMVADLFELDGWDTHFFSATTPRHQILQAIADTRPDLLALSATLTTNVPDIRQLITELRNTGLPVLPKIMVGGYPFHADPELWRRIGADSTAPGAEEAVQEGNRLCPGP